MDNKEALLWFKEYSRIDGHSPNHKPSLCAINGIEKQIPLKQKHGVCPKCSTNNDKIIKNLGNPKGHKVIYCWNCGQALDLE